MQHYQTGVSSFQVPTPPAPSTGSGSYDGKFPAPTAPRLQFVPARIGVSVSAEKIRFSKTKLERNLKIKNDEFERQNLSPTRKFRPNNIMGFTDDNIVTILTTIPIKIYHNLSFRRKPTFHRLKNEECCARLTLDEVMELNDFAQQSKVERYDHEYDHAEHNQRTVPGIHLDLKRTVFDLETQFANTLWSQLRKFVYGEMVSQEWNLDLRKYFGVTDDEGVSKYLIHFAAACGMHVNETMKQGHEKYNRRKSRAKKKSRKEAKKLALAKAEELKRMAKEQLKNGKIDKGSKGSGKQRRNARKAKTRARAAKELAKRGNTKAFQNMTKKAERRLKKNRAAEQAKKDLMTKGELDNMLDERELYDLWKGAGKMTE